MKDLFTDKIEKKAIELRSIIGNHIEFEQSKGTIMPRESLISLVICFHLIKKDYSKSKRAKELWDEVQELCDQDVQ